MGTCTPKGHSWQPCLLPVSLGSVGLATSALHDRSNVSLMKWRKESQACWGRCAFPQGSAPRQLHNRPQVPQTEQLRPQPSKLFKASKATGPL